MIFSDHIPPDFLDNPNVRKLTKVLDELGIYKGSILYRSVNKIVNPILQDDPNFLHQFLDDVAHLDNMHGIARISLENLILNAYDIFSYKGTNIGICLYLRSLLDLTPVTFDNTIITESLGVVTCQGVTLKIVMDFTDYWGSGVYLHLNNLEGLGVLPNGESLTVPVTVPETYPYLFGGRDFPYYYRHISIKLYSNIFVTYAYRRFVTEVLPKYLPMVDINSTVLTVLFYSTEGVAYPINNNLEV